MKYAFSIRNETEALEAAAAICARTGAAGGGAADRSLVVKAAIDGVVRALRTGATLTLEMDGGSSCELRLDGERQPVESLARLPVSAGVAVSDGHAPAALLEEISKLLAGAIAMGEELRKSRAMIGTLENELDETNRGVMALYAELDERADKLRKADELKSRFLSYASHELRTPLNGIVGLVRLLKSGGPHSGEEAKQLDFIQSAAEEMREMVNDLLDLAKVEAGKVTVQPTEFDLSFVFGALRGIFRPLLDSEAVTLIMEDTSAVPAIYSDEGKVSQILRNLLSNALKFTERGTIKVWAVAEGDLVKISVSDTGLGIPQNQLSRIFDEFAQLDNPLQRRSRGTGLGLPLCRKLADLLGGSLSVESEVGKGSIFTLILPRSYPTSRDGMAAVEPKRARNRTTVLIVDDVEIDRYLLSRLITAGGDYDIIQTVDGKAGLEAARKERPDLIFLDINLPLMDGFAVATEIRADPATREIPIFAVSAEKFNDLDLGRLRDLTQGIIAKEQLSQARAMKIDLNGKVRVTFQE